METYSLVSKLKKKKIGRKIPCTARKAPWSYGLLNKTLVPDVANVWVVDQGGSRGLQNNVGSCHCSWLLSRTKWQDPVAEDTVQLGCLLQRKKVENWAGSLCLLGTFHSYAGCWRKKHINGLAWIWNPPITTTYQPSVSTCVIVTWLLRGGG